MSQESFQDRLARLEARSTHDLAERRFDYEIGRTQSARRGSAQRSEHEDDDSDSVFWVFYVLGAILIAAAYGQFPQYGPEILFYGLPGYALLGVVKLIATIRRRGFSVVRDGDRALEIADAVSGLFKLFK